MKIAVRCIWHRPVTPNFLVINLDEAEWPGFLCGDSKRRIEIVRPYLPKYHPPVKEISWIPLDGLKDTDKAVLIINLLQE